MKQKPIAIFEQFNDRGRKITYMFEFLGRKEYPTPMPHSIALFKIYDKKERSLWDKIFCSRGYKKTLSRHIIASQVNATL